MANKIIHGNRNFGYAPIEVGTNGEVFFGTPVMLLGMVSATVEVEQSDSTIYADNKSWFVSKGAKVRTAECAFREISKEYAQFLGYKLNANGMLTDTGKFPNHCIFFERTKESSDGSTTYILCYLYSVKGSTPTIETQTDEDEVEAAEISVSYTGSDSEIAKDDDGEYVQYGELERTDENATLYDTFKQAVLLPTSTK